MSLRQSAFSIFFFLSGYIGLSYQILWHKKLILLFGAVSYSTVAVFIAFFLGFAFGGQLADKKLKNVHPLKAYAAAELIVFLWGIVFINLYPIVDAHYVNLPIYYKGEFYLRLLGSVSLLLPATVAMGATLPLMIRSLPSFVSPVKTAYGLNTLGAVCGVLATSFVFLPVYGIESTLKIIGILNLLLVVSSYYVASRIIIKKTPTTPLEEDIPKLHVFSYFLLGAVSIGLEMVWLRILSLYTSSGHFMFAIFMAIYLLGFSLGSFYLYAWLSKKFKSAEIIFIAVLGLVLSSLLGDYLLRQAPHVAQYFIFNSIARGDLSQLKIMLSEMYPIFVLVLLPTLFLGMLYPAYVDKKIFYSGKLYFWGCIGGCVAIMLSIFFFIPQWGMISSIAIWLVVSMTAYVLVMLKHFHHKKMITLILASGFVVSWSLSVKPHTKFVLKGAEDKNILCYKTGEISTVTVRQEEDTNRTRRLYIDEQSVASTLLREVVDAKMLAHLPIFLHPFAADSIEFLSVGFGSGGTAKALSTYPMKSTIVEIESEVLSAAKLFPYWSELNLSKLKIENNDARDFLRRTKKQFDIIVTDVTNIQYKQNPSLYTVEYFQLMKSKLKREGIAAAWIPLASITNSELKILIASFMKSFPFTTLWHMNQVKTTFAILIATPQEFSWDSDSLEENRQKKWEIQKVQEDLRSIAIYDREIFKNFLMLNTFQLQNLVQDSEKHTDDRSVLEYRTPFSFYRYHELLQENLKMLINAKEF